MLSSYSTFQDAIRAAGLEPPEIIEPGRIHRFSGRGKGPGNRAAWCRLFTDREGGCFGDYSSGTYGTWYRRTPRRAAWNAAPPRVIRPVTDCNQADFERRRFQQKAAQTATYVWSRAIPADDHPYLRLKGIKPYGSRLYKGALTLPILTFEGNLVSLQFIDAKGNKQFLKGGRKRGCYIPVSGSVGDAHRIVICEGFATGCSLAEDESGSAVLAAIDAGNLKSVAISAREKWPDVQIVIAGDDDRLTVGNTGATKAREAAISCGGLLALPEWPEGAPEGLTDFNDLAQWLKSIKT